MKKVLSIAVAVLLATAAVTPSASAFQTTTARRADVQRLQDELASLQDSLAALPTTHARYSDFQRRVDTLNQDLVQLRDQIRQGRNDSGYGVSLDEVNRMSTRIGDLQADIDTALNRRWNGAGSISLPEGTEMTVRLDQPLSSRSARVEDRFQASVARAVSVDGRMVVPAGTRVQGTVTQAEPAQRPARGGRLNLSFDRLLLDDGTTVDLSTRLVQVKEDLGSGGTVKHGAIGAAIGGILGSVIGGKTGAVVGVLVGGAGGAITSTGDDVELPEGTVFELQLEREATVLRR